MFRIDPGEISAPRARVNLVRGVLSGSLDRETIVQRSFCEMTERCIQCRSCTLRCPAQVDVAELVTELKGAYVSVNGLSVHEWFACRIDLGCAMASRLSPLRGFADHRWFRWLIEKLFGMSRRRRVPGIVAQPFLRRAARRGLSLPIPPNTPEETVPDGATSDQATTTNAVSNGTDTLKVAYFVDIFANWNAPELAEALVAILEHHGIHVYVPPDQVASGGAAIRFGAFDLARRYATRNLNAMTDAARRDWTILTTEPSATRTLQWEYATLFNADSSDEDDVRLVARATQDAELFLWNLHLAGRLQNEMRPIPATIGYYAPCRLAAQEIGLPGLSLLRLIPELQVQEIEAGCCGMAGGRGLQAKYVHESLRIGRNLAAHLRGADYAAVATECGACRIQIEQMSHRATFHPLQLLAAAWGLMPIPDPLMVHPASPESAKPDRHD